MKPENRPKTQFDGREYDDYQAAQMQRRIEATIRRQKRLKTAYEAAGLTDQATAANIRLRRLNEKYHQFSKAAGLPEQRERMRVVYVDDSNLAPAPQGNIVTEGETFNPESAAVSLIKRLEDSPGMEDNMAVLRYYANHTDLVVDKTMAGPIAYNRSLDAICYNPDVPLPYGADRDGIFAHELAHRADKLWYGATQDLAWSTAVQEAESVILENVDAVESWFETGGKYADNAFFSDIIGAVSKGKINTPYSHSSEYWRRAGNCEREVFANLVALDFLFGIDTVPVEFGLDTICKVFREIIGRSGLL